MSTQHTPGRLISSHQFFNEGAPLFIATDSGQIVARIENRVSGRPLTQEDAENARRLVACWNLFEGVPTKELEKGGANYVSWTRELQSQRNEMLEALNQINMLACYASEEATETREAVLLHIGETARAAIAKAEGGAS